MSLKVKLASLCSMFVLIISLLIVGVWCLTNIELNMGGNVSFIPGEVVARVEGTVTGTKDAVTLPTLLFENDGETPDTKDWERRRRRGRSGQLL